MIDVQIDPVAFKNYRDNFDFMILPKGAALRYEQSSPQEKDAWFLMRYKCREKPFVSEWIYQGNQSGRS